MRRAAFVFVLAATASCRAGYQSPSHPCSGVTCSDRGRCAQRGDAALCICDPGFAAQGLDCVTVADPCSGTDCSGHGRCGIFDDAARCLCDDGYAELDGGGCGPVVSPCAGAACDGHGTCIVTADGQPRCACDLGYRNAGPMSCQPDP
ncbi:MAG: hypothetical protein JXR83_13675 [Deltaproteobacteria bacterium]|nr:hypothetical protein [Deltaproteobacteria bacterium]